MPKTKAQVKSSTAISGKLLATLQFHEKLPRAGEVVNVQWGSVRTPSQNNLYWRYLTWIINEGGLKDQGHFCADALHLDLKTHFLSEKKMDKGQFKSLEEPTTTSMGKTEFGEYVEKIDHFMIEFFKINTAPFWEEYGENKL